MTRSFYSPNIINNKLCVCKNKLVKKINFGNLPIINNYTSNINLKKYPVIVSQCEKCQLIHLKYSIPDKFLFPKNCRICLHLHYRARCFKNTPNKRP